MWVRWWRFAMGGLVGVFLACQPTGGGVGPDVDVDVDAGGGDAEADGAADVAGDVDVPPAADSDAAPGEACGVAELRGGCALTAYPHGTFGADCLFRDGPAPSWGLAEQLVDGDCRFFGWAPALCDPPCEAPQVCTVAGTCGVSPQNLDAGRVRFEGTTPPIELEPTEHNNYYSTEPYDALFEPGSTLSVAVAGSAAVDAWSREVRGVAPVDLANTTFVMREHQDFVVSWTPAPVPAEAEVVVHMDIDHHAIPAYAECITKDAAGAVTVSAAIVDALIEAGQSGIGTYVENATVTRRTRALTRIGLGCVRFDSTSTDWFYVDTELAP